jgi:hypothetical protein
MIYQTVSKSQFIDAFKQSETRKNQFSYEALEALYQYLEESSYGEQYELDIVAICCDWQEATWKEVAEQYRLDLEDYETEVDKIRAVSEYLWNETHSIDLDDGNFLFVNF